MDDFLLDIIAAREADDENVDEETLSKKLGDRISELDNILMEIHAIATIEERNLNAVLRHNVPTCYFLSFLLLEMSAENLLFYLEVENFKKKVMLTQDLEFKLKYADQMYKTYVKAQSILEINIISAVREAIQQALTPESLETGYDILGHIFDDAQKACFILMTDTWKRFKNSSIYTSMLGRLKLHPVDSVESKKASILQVLSHFNSRPESVITDDSFDYLQGDASFSADKVIKQKTFEFLKRINLFDQQELDPEWLIQNANKTEKIVISTREYHSQDPEAISFGIGSLILIQERTSPHIWLGKVNGKGKAGTFPSNFVQPTSLNSIEQGLERLGEPETNTVQYFLPQLFKSIVQSCSQIIQTAQPPSASWVLDGLVGTIVSITQLVAVSDSIIQRVYLFKDVRWLQHCSSEVVTHLKTMSSAIQKAYSPDNRIRASNPNYLSPTSVDKLFSVITDLIRATKELASATLPVVNSLLPEVFDSSIISRLFIDKITVIDLRKSLEQSLNFLKRSVKHTHLAISSYDDVSFILRGSIATTTASLQIIESISTMGQLDQKIPETAYDHISSIAQNVNTLHELSIKCKKESQNRSLLKESSQKIERMLEVLERNASTVVEEISLVQNVNLESRPDSIIVSGVETLDQLMKEMVMCISQFLTSLNEKNKTELIPQAEKIKEIASKVGNKVVFDLTNLGISGIKKYEDIASDGSDLVKNESKNTEEQGKEETDTKLKNTIKELAQAIMMMISTDPESHSQQHKKGFQQAMKSIKMLVNLAYSVADHSKNETISFSIRKWNSNLTSCTERFQIAAQETSGLIPSPNAVAELKASCTSLLATTKELAGAISLAISDPTYCEEEDLEPPYMTGPVSPFNAPVSPFNTQRAKPQSPFDASRRTSIVSQSPKVISRSTSHEYSKRATVVSETPGSILKNETNAYLRTIAESVHKIKLNATLAAGVWPPPNIDVELKTSCHSVAKSVKGIMSVFEQISSGERDRKERELAQHLSIWKSYRLKIHSYLIDLKSELVSWHFSRQQDESDERKKVLAQKQAKQQTSSKVWIEKAANTDYEKWYKGLCTEEVLSETLEDIELEPGSDPKDPKPSQTKGGSLNGLVAMLTYYKYPDPDYTRAFLMTYRSFTTPEELLSLIIERYNSAPPENMTNVKQMEYYYVKKIVPIRMRVSNVIRTWLENHFEDFMEKEGRLLGSLNEFIEKQMLQIDDNLATLLQKTISKKLEGKEERKQVIQTNTPEILITDKWIGQQTRLVDINVLEIARQLTLIDHKIYSSIQPKEFLNQAWSKEALKDRALNLRGLIRRSNDLTYFVATEILRKEDLAERQSVLLHFIMVAGKCLEINSFNAMVSIYSALSSSPIHRLKKTWEALQLKENAAHQQVWQKLETITDASGNRSNYRNTLHSINPPCVPFLGMYLTDLVFIDDGNADTLQVGNKSFINFQKRMKTSSIIREIQQFQQTPYNFKEWSDLIKYMLRTDHLFDDSEMYKQSMKVEPRVKT